MIQLLLSYSGKYSAGKYLCVQPMEKEAGNMLSCMRAAWCVFPHQQPGAREGQNRQSLHMLRGGKNSPCFVHGLRSVGSGSFLAAHSITFSLQLLPLCAAKPGWEAAKWGKHQNADSATRSWMLFPGLSWASCNTKTVLILFTFLRHFLFFFFFSWEGNILFIQVLLILTSSMWLGKKLN